MAVRVPMLAARSNHVSRHKAARRPRPMDSGTAMTAA
jgi:hypothetical protein